MELDKRKRIIKNILTNSFVNDYHGNKKVVAKFNGRLRKLNIPVNYSYDAFCIEFLNSALKSADHRDFFIAVSFDEFYGKLSKFNRILIKDMEINKFVTYCL